MSDSKKQKSRIAKLSQIKSLFEKNDFYNTKIGNEVNNHINAIKTMLISRSKDPDNPYWNMHFQEFLENLPKEYHNKIVSAEKLGIQWIETRTENFKADPSQGSHFFQNITSLGISYLTTSENGDDFINWKWLQSLPTAKQTNYLHHVKLENPMTIPPDSHPRWC